MENLQLFAILSNHATSTASALSFHANSAVCEYPRCMQNVDDNYQNVQYSGMVETLHTRNLEEDCRTPYL